MSDKKKNRISYRAKLITIVTIVLLAATFSMGGAVMRQSENALKEIMQERMLDLVNVAADTVDGDFMERLSPEDVGSEEYQQVLSQLRLFQENIMLDYIYTTKRVGDKEYIMTIDADFDEPAEYGYPVVYSPAMDMATNGTAAVDTEPTADEWGKFYSAYSPIHNSKGEVVGIVGVDFDAKWYDEQMAINRRTILVISLLSLFVGAAIVVAITSRIRRQFSEVNMELNDLSEDLESLAHEVGIEDESESAARVSDQDAGRFGAINYDDELSKLSYKLHYIHRELRLYIIEVRSRAYIDNMTGVGNRAAYADTVKQCEEKIAGGCADFAVAIMDINGLKNVNDNLGHEKGDIIIRDTAKLLMRSFGENDVYRLGGDEFIVIISGITATEMQEAFDDLDAQILHFNTEEKDYEMVISVSKGFSVYDPENDTGYKSVFKRADEAMYEDKAAYYMKHGDRRRR